MTIFQNKVYKVVSKIPKGKVLTYKKVASLAGHFKSWRAVGNLLNKNKNLYPPKFSKKTLAGKKIPCHRVIRSDGKIGGFNKGVRNKIRLLNAEGLKIIREKINLPPHHNEN